MTRFWAAGLLLRRLRNEPGVMLLILLLIAGTSFVFAAAPRLFNRVSDDALRYQASTAASAQRNLALSLASSLSPGTQGGVSGVESYGARLEERFPSSVESLIGERSLLVSSARFSVPDPPSYTTFLTLRYQGGLTDHSQLVDGRWPVDLGVPIPQATIGLGSQGDVTDVEPIRLEAALSADAAKAIGAKVGDRLGITVDDSDPVLGRTFYQIVPVEVEIVGLYRATDAAADYWYGDASLLQIALAGTLDNPVAYATAYIPAETYPTLVSAGMPFRYQWRYFVNSERLDAGQVGALETDLRRMESDFVTGSSELVRPGSVVLRTGLLPILERYDSQRASSEAVLSIAAIGPFALAAGALGMVALLLVTRRRAGLTLARGRGASGALLLGAQLWEAAIFAGAAALAGLLAALQLVSARGSPLSASLALAVGAAATLLMVGASWPTAERPLGQLERDDPPVLRVSPRRLVIELTIVVIAGAGAMLLRQRGLTVGAAGGSAHFDPLLAAVPVLAGLAVGIVAMRLYPLPIRGLGWLAARRRDLVPVLGLRTIGRHPAAANLPLLVLMLTAAFGAFSSVIVASVDRGQVAASYVNVGADYRIEKIGLGALGPSLDPSTVPGIEAVAPGLVDPSAAFSSVPNQRATILLEAVDPAAYDAVTAGSPADPGWPAAFLADPDGPGLGTPQHPIPAIVSPRLPIGSAGLGVGDTFTMTAAGQRMTFQLTQQRASFPGIAAGGSFAVVPFNYVQAAFENPPLRPSVLWLRGPADAGPALADLVAQQASSARIVSRHTAFATLHDAPLVAAVGSAFGLALVIAAAYTALTIVGSLILSAARRTQDLAYLRTLGVTGSQALALTVVEHAPPVLMALIPGVALGIGVAYLLEPGLGLSAFVGTDGSVPLLVNWLTLGLLVAALVGVVMIAVGAGTWISRRARLVDALRIGDD